MTLLLGICLSEQRRDDVEDFEQLKKFRKAAIHKEIGDIILERINQNEAPDDEAFVEMIEEKLDKSNTKLSLIPLGKNQDGSKLISLKDIWYDNQKRKQYHI